MRLVNTLRYVLLLFVRRKWHLVNGIWTSHKASFRAKKVPIESIGDIFFLLSKGIWIATTNAYSQFILLWKICIIIVISAYLVTCGSQIYYFVFTFDLSFEYCLWLRIMKWVAISNKILMESMWAAVALYKTGFSYFHVPFFLFHAYFSWTSRLV